MKQRCVLIYSHVAMWGIHHAEAIELCLKHHNRGDRVILLSCDGALISCPANQRHAELTCMRCRGQTRRSLTKILPHDIIDVRLQLKESVQRVNQLSRQFIQNNVLTDLQYGEMPVGQLVFNQIISEYRDAFIDLSHHYRRVSTLYSNAIALYENIREIVEERGVDLIYVWNGRRASDGPVCFAAKSMSIEWATFISARKNGHYLLFEKMQMHDFNTHKERLKAFHKSFYSSDYESKLLEGHKFFHLIRSGQGDWNGFQNFVANQKSKQIIKKKPLLVIFSSTLWETAGMPGYNHSKFGNQYVALNDILMRKNLTENWDIRVRWHPNLAGAGIGESKEIDRIIKKTEMEVKHYPPDDPIYSYSLLDSADLVLHFGSTIGVEATYYGKPSILLGRAVYEDLDVCYTARDVAELLIILGGRLRPKSTSNCVVYGAYQRIAGTVPFQHVDIKGTEAILVNGRQLVNFKHIDRLKRKVKNFIKSVFKVITLNL